MRDHSSGVTVSCVVRGRKEGVREEVRIKDAAKKKTLLLTQLVCSAVLTECQAVTVEKDRQDHQGPQDSSTDTTYVQSSDSKRIDNPCVQRSKMAVDAIIMEALEPLHNGVK